MTPAPMLAFRDVRVRYPRAERDAVDGVSLDVARGEFVVMLGASGCGKSSLLRTVNRIVEPSGGSVAIDGVDVKTREPSELRRGIGYVIQAVGLFPHYTVAENVAVVPRLLGWPRERIDARVDELLAMVRLDPARYRERRPRMLSGGEAQRVGVARALAVEPPLLLMDEPFGALDPVVRSELQGELAAIVRRLGTTVLMVTHDIEEALSLADRIVVLDRGRVVQVARPLELLTAPATPDVAALAGSADILRRLSLVTAAEILARGACAAPTASPVVVDGTTSAREALGLMLRAGTDQAEVRFADGGGGRIGIAELLRGVAAA